MGAPAPPSRGELALGPHPLATRNAMAPRTSRGLTALSFPNSLRLLPSSSPEFRRRPARAHHVDRQRAHFHRRPGALALAAGKRLLPAHVQRLPRPLRRSGPPPALSG